MASRQGGLQIPIDVGIEKGKPIESQKSYNALLEMAIADFSIVRAYLIGQLNQAAFGKHWMLQRWLVQDSSLQVRTRLEVRFFILFKY